MSYYPGTATTSRQAVGGGYYDTMPSSSSQAQLSVQTYDPYAVAAPPPLTIPPVAAADLPSSSSSTGLPQQHRASSGAWSPQDDATLLQARAQGQNWAQIQAAYFPFKTPNACRKRHERLMERRGADDWDARKMERLAREYMTMRKEIWGPLAQRTGEKWNVVEQKCMSRGLKNLQSASRSCARRERLERSGQHQHQHMGQHGGLSGYDDDSGISGIGGLTPAVDVDEEEEVDELQAAHYGAGGASSSPEPHSSATSSSSGGGGYSYSAYAAAAAQGYHQGYGGVQHHQQGAYAVGAGGRMGSEGGMGIDAIIHPGPGRRV
ncbi:uncharacterized protein E0L32_004641 [Thyridium curvatum]|uniref:Myb-like domain-containing protein n=1 Tax=Thyridium curvatum TaxID=1093900 RepID=A0A507B9S4_9PEZI|nr:uncharacterized protein E0L32_004641 [Thyridium curvatum]TPX15364.1 hypothetical protein E0L32_004641 [Thyridium curvatum]